MSRQLREVDVYLQRQASFVYAQAIDDANLAAVGATDDEAMERLRALLARVLERTPAHLPPAQHPIEARHVRVSIPTARMGRLTQLPLHLFAICRREEERWQVFLPQLNLEFRVRDLSELDAITAEVIRDRYPLSSRLESLVRFATPLGAAGEDSATLRLDRLQVRFRPKQAEEDDPVIATPTLSSVGDPLHLRLDRKDAPRAFQRRAEVETLLDYLSEAAERSVLLTGPAGVGKTAIVFEAVRRMLDEDAPEQLHGTHVWQVSGGRLMAGMRYLGQWQERILAVIDEAKTTGAILFVDNLIELLESAGKEHHGEGIPGLLLPHILSGDLVVVTELRPEQLARAEQSHPSFLRALRRLPIEAMSPADADAVLERVSFRLGRQFGVRLAPTTRQRILELVGRFKGPAELPGPAVDLAERMARTHRSRGVIEEGEERPLLTSEHAVEAYASMTGLPQHLLDPDASFSADEVRHHFESQIFAQPEAVDAVVDLVTTIRAGLNAPDRPLGSFLFLGPTGVGKTQTALTLAEYLFGSRERVLRFDMSEYQDAWSAGRLVGRYKGERGELVRRLREQPFQIVLLDEIEKAHSSVFDYLLQVLGEGRLTDALGQTVSFTSAVVIMTSNLGAGGPSSLGFQSDDVERARQSEVAHYMGAVERAFRPELIGRLERIIPFRSLGPETARRLVRRALDEAFAREGLVRREMQVRADDEVVAHLITTGFDERYGARPLRRVVENLITAPLASFLAGESGLEKMRLIFRMRGGVPELELEE